MKPVAGKRILLTRSERGCREWEGLLRARGAVPVSFPCIQTQLIDDPDLPGRLRQALERASWLVFSSATAVEAVDSLLPEGVAPGLGIGTVGPRTAAVACRRFGRIDLVSSRGTGASLARDVLRRLEHQGTDSGHVVTAAAADGRRDLEAVLEPAGISVLRIPVYRTAPCPPLAPRRCFDEGVDVVFLASPSAVVGLRARADLQARIPIVTIGPTTSAAAREAGLRVAGEAERRSLDAMLEVVP